MPRGRVGVGLTSTWKRRGAGGGPRSRSCSLSTSPGCRGPPGPPRSRKRPETASTGATVICAWAGGPSACPASTWGGPRALMAARSPYFSCGHPQHPMLPVSPRVPVASVSPCPLIPIFSCLHVPVSPHAFIHPCPYVPIPLFTHIPMYQCPPMSPCPHIPMSQCPPMSPHVPLSPCPHSH